jgi:hypothetical protein
MDPVLIQATIWATVIIIVYGILARGLVRAAEVHRQKALDLAVELVGFGKLPELDRSMIKHVLGDMHSAPKAWSLALTAVRVAVSFPFAKHDAVQTVSATGVELPRDIEAKYQEFVSAWIVSTVSNSPVAASIFFFTTIVTMAFHVSTVILSATILRRQGAHDIAHDPHNHARA